MENLPLEFIKNTHIQLLQDQKPYGGIPELATVWGNPTCTPKYIPFPFFCLSTDTKSLVYDKWNTGITNFLKNSEEYHLPVFILRMKQKNEDFISISDKQLAVLQKAMIKCQAPASVSIVDIERVLPRGYSSMFSYAPFLQTMINCFPRINVFRSDQNDPLAHEIIFRAFNLGTLQTLELSKYKFPKEFVAKLTTWILHSTHFKSLKINSFDDGEVEFYDLLGRFTEIARKLEQRKVRAQLGIHRNIYENFTEFNTFKFIYAIAYLNESDRTDVIDFWRGGL
ncbi:hypothetical protein L596_025167 [Steinernema carpocapsae]|uniref:Uncharacterized protein n=1 Tax=Steinernema carpocapsae TaxID=34508 RepID=A0A4U5M706_STECR|nr:hypothetical protein L596_025167 [Steinernema carpocapsae]